MQFFEDMDDVQEWLKPPVYDEFWKETEFFSLFLPDRDACEVDIRNGIVSRRDVLGVLKAMARAQIVLDQRLPPRFMVLEFSMH